MDWPGAGIAEAAAGSAADASPARVTARDPASRRNAVVVGGGPAGLMAAEMLAAAGAAVDLYDAMPSVARKLLLAGKGGLNLTHSEPANTFVARYGERTTEVARWLGEFGPTALRQWASALGVATFIGSSGRVFPVDMKSAPLVRRWISRLRVSGVRFHMRHRLLQVRPGTDGAQLTFATPGGELSVDAAAVVLALGGGSWPRLGSDGAWVEPLRQVGIDIATLRPANCGFDVAGWSDHLRGRHAGAPLKSVAVSLDGEARRHRGEFVLTESGVEGSLIYALSAALRERIGCSGSAVLRLDLLPDHPAERVLSELRRPRGPRSLATHLKSRLGLYGVKSALLHELLSAAEIADAERMAVAIKSLPLRLVAARPLAEAISSAGGIRLEAMDAALMLHALPGVFAAGEMLDWEAPTGGYLLSACWASGRFAGVSAAEWLAARRAANVAA